ncbi:GH25 family lysozyme [Bombilactobacillus bombi]|uniref:GH25 family lysozyme n=1 Tax=Bombilactobacillus bombi TaxID=1303590 RepID=UPI0015E5AF03|nr:GH25 family lysozyme [Bombilactobacillus bombi]MBA1434946.1 hypothetical protein [Bombilactobacillus bombi]
MKHYQLQHAQPATINHRQVFLILITSLIVSVFLGLLWLRHLQNMGRPDVHEYPILGVSVSQEDGYQDFRLLQKHGVDFVYLKATQGADYFDDSFLDNYWRLQGAQIPFGVYHYFSFSSTPQSQFANFKTSVGRQIGTLPIVIQINDYQRPRPTTKKIKQSVTQLQTLLVNYYQRKVIIQTPTIWVGLFNKRPNSSWLQASKPPLHMEMVDFWEYSRQGQIPSLATNNLYHLSVFMGNSTRWQHYVQSGGY